MSDFAPFSKAVHTQYNKLAKQDAALENETLEQLQARLNALK